MVRDFVGDDAADLAETAELLVSELVTNALLHAGTEIEVVATVDAGGLRVVVTDGGAHLPARRHHSDTAGTGRGMMMLETLADDCGVIRRSHGKSVWFLLTRAAHDDRPSSLTSDLSVESYPRATVQMVFLNVPLLLHAAWQEHAAALLREYLLVSMGDEDGGVAMQVHADATDAMSILEESIPQTHMSIVPDELMRDVTNDNVSRPRVEVSVPVHSIAHFHILNDSLEAALRLSSAGDLLTPPTQPEIQELRRWLCREVIQQAEGAVPHPWSVEHQTLPSRHMEVLWDATSVTTSADAVVAADDTSRIVATSRPAVELLGYHNSEELIGHRLISIIPERFRQGHVAGFSMYLLNGRQPLLRIPITVPAQRRDGTEAMVELVIDTQPTLDGHDVFVATMRKIEEDPATDG